MSLVVTQERSNYFQVCAKVTNAEDSIMIVCVFQGEKDAEAVGNSIKCYNGQSLKRTFAEKTTNTNIQHPSLSMVLLTQMKDWDLLQQYFECGFSARHLPAFLEKRIQLYSSDHQSSGQTELPNLSTINLDEVAITILQWILREGYLSTLVEGGPDYCDFRFSPQADFKVCGFV